MSLTGSKTDLGFQRLLLIVSTGCCQPVTAQQSQLSVPDRIPLTCNFDYKTSQSNLANSAELSLEHNCEDISHPLFFFSLFLKPRITLASLSDGFPNLSLPVLLHMHLSQNLDCLFASILVTASNKHPLTYMKMFAKILNKYFVGKDR